MGRETVPPGIPGMPGMPVPDRASSPVSEMPGRPPSDKAVMALFDGKAQLVGTDIDPSLPALTRVADTLPRLAPPPMLDAALLS